MFVPIKTKLCDKKIFPKPNQEVKNARIKETSKMFPINENKKDELNSMLGKSLICNDEDLEIQGDFQASEAKLILAIFERCDPQ